MVFCDFAQVNTQQSGIRAAVEWAGIRWSGAR